MFGISVEQMWMGVGFLGQAFFGLRFVFQWIATERAKRSIIPISFWYLSLGGSIVLLAYSIYKRDAVFMLGFSLNLFVYSRNLWFVYHHRAAGTTSD